MLSRCVLVLVALCVTSPTSVTRAQQVGAVDSSIVVRTRPPLRPALRALDSRLGRIRLLIRALEREEELDDELDGLPAPWDAHGRNFVHGRQLASGDRLAFANLAFAHGSATCAADAFDDVAEDRPLEPVDALRRASAYATNGSPSQALEALEGIDEPRVTALRKALEAARASEDEGAPGLDLERALVVAELVTPDLVLRLGRDFFLEDPRARARLDLLVDALRALGDHEGALLALAARDELPDSLEVDRAVELVQRGNAAHAAGNLDEAIAAWREVIDRHPTTCGWGVAVFNVGVAMTEASRWAEAIPVFEALIASDVDDEEPGGNVMEATRDYHHRAALELSTCHERLEAWGQALAWALAARDRFQSASWCGTCVDSDRDELAARIERVATRMR